MSKVYHFLFCPQPDSRSASWLILALRILFGALLISHGIQKLSHFDALYLNFPDPLGIGSYPSLILAICAEAVCSIAFIFGFLYRLTLIPMIFTMGMAVFVIHAGDPFAVKELAFCYLMVFALLFIIGPGRYSLDYFINGAIYRNQRDEEDLMEY